MAFCMPYTSRALPRDLTDRQWASAYALLARTGAGDAG